MGKPLFNQTRGIVEIETDGGLIGIGEGCSKAIIEQCAQMMIGENSFRIEPTWQNLYRVWSTRRAARNSTPREPSFTG